MSCHVMSCHVMSCHVMSPLLYLQSKKFLSKTFSFHKIIYKYFAGLLACSPHGFQLDKFQRFLSVIYKKLLIKGDLNYVKSQQTTY